MIQAANISDLKWIMFSEHNRKDSEYSYKKFSDEILEKSNKYKNITLIKGAECKIKNFKGSWILAKRHLNFQI